MVFFEAEWTQGDTTHLAMESSLLSFLVCEALDMVFRYISSSIIDKNNTIHGQTYWILPLKHEQ